MSSKRYWFRAKWFGWGWYPSSWQGWLVTAGYLWFVLWDYKRIFRIDMLEGYKWAHFLPDALILTTILIIICYRTGEKPRWRWGI